MAMKGKRQGYILKCVSCGWEQRLSLHKLYEEGKECPKCGYPMTAKIDEYGRLVKVLM